jgi:hypothetical protein
MPGQGRSQFVGPLDLGDSASSFVVQGLPTEFFILPSAIERPVFVATERIPRRYIEVRNGRISRFVLASDDRPVNLDMSGIRMVLPVTASYFDVQKRIAATTGAQPAKILLMYDDVPMTPREYATVKTFPHGRPMSYQVLNGQATVCSLCLYIPISFLFVSPMFVFQPKTPVWLEVEVTAEKLLLDLPARLVPELRRGRRLTLQCSRGRAGAIEKVCANSYQLRAEPIRVDVVRYQFPTEKWQLLYLLDRKLPMSIELRFPKSRALDQFIGVSRVVSITLTSTFRDIRRVLARLQQTYLSEDMDAFLFATKKVKLQADLGLDANLYDEMKAFITKFSFPRQRVCIGLVAHDALVMMRIQRPLIARSLSGTINMRD